MDSDADRVAALEADMRRLEARLARLEQGSTGIERSAAAEPPLPPPAAAPMPPTWVAPTPRAAQPASPQSPWPATGSPTGLWQATATGGTSAVPAGAPAGDGGRAGALSLRDLEERFAGRALAIIGGLALVAAAIFFLSLAFSRGWVTEPMRVAIGLAAGGGAFAIGAWRLTRHDRLLGTVLVGVGIGILEIALFAATSLYGLLPAEAGLAGALAVAIVAAAVAIRFDARVVAAYGLVAALVAPPLVGAAATPITLGFLAIVLVGTTAIALFRTWRWLPPIAFVLTAPQLAAWLSGDPELAPALVALVAFWLVTLVAAAGEEVRIRRDDLRPSSAALVVANAAFLVWGGLVVLTGALEPWRGLFVLLAAVAHLGVGAWFLERQGWQHLFGTLVAGTGAALLAVAALVQLDAPVVAGAWAAESVALAWLAVRRRHRWSALAAAVMLLVAAVDVALVYLLTAFDTQPRAIPNPELFVLGAVLAAMAVGAWMVRVRWVRSLLIAVAVSLVGWAMLFEGDGVVVLAGWAALLPLAVVGDRLLAGLHDDAELRTAWRLGIPGTTAAWPGTVAGILAWLAAAGTALVDQLSPADWGSVTPSVIPLTDERALIAAVLAATVILAGAATESAVLRRAAAVLAVAVGAVVAPFEVHADLVVVAWIGLAVAAVGYLRWDARAVIPMTVLACTLVAGAAIVAFAVVAPPTRLVVVDPVAVSRPPLLPLWPLSFAALAGVLVASPRHRPLASWWAWLQLAGGAVAVYGISVGVVAGFQRLVGGSVPPDELATQAQVALSVTWTLIGVVALGAGMATRRSLLRQGGLGLLALATVKVFVVDLAAMDVAYRALVLAGLGVLLLFGAWVLTRFRGPRAGQVIPVEPGEEAEAAG